MIQEVVDDWAHHVSEDVLTNEVDGVLNDNDGEIDELMHDKGNEPVIVIEVWVTKLDVHVVDDWLEVSFLCEFKINLIVKLEIFEFKLDLTLSR